MGFLGLKLGALLGITAIWLQLGAAQSISETPAGQTAPSAAVDSNPDKKTDGVQAPTQPDSTALEVIKSHKADYPREARERELQGEVWLKVFVSETGDVESAEVVSGNPVLAKAAMDAVKKWKFKPFIKNGKPVKISTRIPVDFAFKGNTSEKQPPDNAISKVTPDDPGNALVTPLKVTGGLMGGLLIHKVAPVYPAGARRAGLEGTVMLHAGISKEGRIVGLQLISGPADLAEAAIGAVQQWRYRPYMLNGEPVAVETQIQVNFQLRAR